MGIPPRTNAEHLSISIHFMENIRVSQLNSPERYAVMKFITAMQ